MRLALGMLLALLAAGALNIGFFVQHGAANTMLSLSLRHPWRSAVQLVTNRQWMFGYAAGWVGWGLYIAALSLAPLSLVQAVSAGGVGVLAVLVHRLGTPLQSRERLGSAVAVAGLVLLGASLAAPVPLHPHARTSVLLVVIASGAALAGLLAGLSQRVRPGATLGCAAGLLFGVGDLATKGAVGGNGLLFVPVLAACTAAAFVTLQMAFQRGRVLETAGVSTLVNNLIPILGGLAVFHEALPGGLGGVARLVSFAAVVAGAVLLAHAPGQDPPESSGPDPASVLGGTHSG